MKLKTQNAIFLLTCLFFTTNFGFAQLNLSPANVVPLDSSLIPSEKLLEKLSAYKFILVGEMHGTEQPVTFARELAKVLSKKKHVKFGFEIPADKMNLSVTVIKASDLQTSPFFTEGDDGRASQAWLGSILELTRTSNVDVFFFDSKKDQMSLNRDSAMFLNVKQEYLKDTNCVVITISGNVHNQISPFRGSKTMGYFIASYLNKSILSVNNLYETGTMYNNTGDGAGVKNIQRNRGMFKSISQEPDFIYFDLQQEFSKQWNAFLFTMKINASYPVKNK